MFTKLSDLKNPLIFDSSAIFNFGHRGNLEKILTLLKVSFELIVTNEVIEEIIKNERYRNYYNDLVKNYFIVKKINHTKGAAKIISQYSTNLGKGELSVIIAASSLDGMAVIDEKLARKIAVNLNIDVIGTLGILYVFFKEKKLNEMELRTLISTLRRNGFRIPELNNKTPIEKYFLGFE